MLKLALGKRANKFTRKLPHKQDGQIGRKLEELLSFQFPNDSKLLKGTHWHSVDVGEYRIIYRVKGEELDVPIIGKRNDDEVYKRLKRMGG